MRVSCGFQVSAAHGGRACAGSANEDGLCNVEGEAL